MSRGIHEKAFIDSLKSCKLSEMREAIRQENKKEQDGKRKLDIQIRDNYLNIYYRGSNAARVRGEKKVEFDEYYFYNKDDGFKIVDGKRSPKKVIMKDVIIKGSLVAKRDELMLLFEKGDYNGYFGAVKKVIDSWLYSFPKPEREIQHEMVACQKLTGYIIIDIEFAVSRKSCYAKCDATPRFDIIAVNDSHELCVIELKKGTAALRDPSGLKEHWECFKGSVGNKGKNKKFVEEMKALLKQKQDIGLIKQGVFIKEDTDVKFLFAYEYKNKSNSGRQQEKRVFDEIFDGIKDNHLIGETIWLN